MASGNTYTDILLAGAFAAFSVDLLVYLLDTIKTRIQSPDYKRLYTNTANGTVNRTLFRGLYQGIRSVILATVPSCKYTPKSCPIRKTSIWKSPILLIPCSRSLLHQLQIHQIPPPIYPHPQPNHQLPRLLNRRTSLLLHPDPSRTPKAKCPNGIQPPPQNQAHRPTQPKSSTPTPPPSPSANSPTTHPNSGAATPPSLAASSPSPRCASRSSNTYAA